MKKEITIRGRVFTIEKQETGIQPYYFCGEQLTFLNGDKFDKFEVMDEIHGCDWEITQHLSYNDEMALAEEFAYIW